MDISSAEFCKLSVQEVADLLLDQITDDHPSSRCKLFGCSDGRMFSLELCMRCVENE